MDEWHCCKLLHFYVFQWCDVKCYPPELYAFSSAEAKVICKWICALSVCAVPWKWVCVCRQTVKYRFRSRILISTKAFYIISPILILKKWCKPVEVFISWVEKKKCAMDDVQVAVVVQIFQSSSALFHYFMLAPSFSIPIWHKLNIKV